MTLMAFFVFMVLMVSAVYAFYLRKEFDRAFFIKCLVGALFFKILVVAFCNYKNFQYFGLPYFPESDVGRFVSWSYVSSWVNLFDFSLYADRADPGMWVIYTLANTWFSEPIYGIQVLLLGVSLLIPLAGDFVGQAIYRLMSIESKGAAWGSMPLPKFRRIFFAICCFYPTGATLVAFTHKDLIVLLFLMLSIGFVCQLVERFRPSTMVALVACASVMTFFRLEMLAVLFVIAGVIVFAGIRLRPTNIFTGLIVGVSFVVVVGLFAVTGATNSAFMRLDTMGEAIGESTSDKMLNKEHHDFSGVGGMVVKGPIYIRYPMGFVALLTKPFPPHLYLVNYTLNSYYVYDTFLLLLTLPFFLIGVLKGLKERLFTLLIPLGYVFIICMAIIYSTGAGNIRYRAMCIPLFALVCLYGWQYRRNYPFVWIGYVLLAVISIFGYFLLKTSF